jgi:hypothetical protein
MSHFRVNLRKMFDPDPNEQLRLQSIVNVMMGGSTRKMLSLVNIMFNI